MREQKILYFRYENLVTADFAAVVSHEIGMVPPIQFPAGSCRSACSSPPIERYFPARIRSAALPTGINPSLVFHSVVLFWRTRLATQLQKLVVEHLLIAYEIAAIRRP